MKARTTRVRFAVTVLAAVALWTAPVVAGAETSQAGRASSDFGIGVVTVLSNVVYMPVKVVYAVLGGVTGTLAYGLTGGNRDVADSIWVLSMGGDYVLTTSMMSGDEEVRFSGLRKSPGVASRAAESRDESGSAARDDEDESGGSAEDHGGSAF